MQEFIDLIIMTIGVGFIFMDSFGIRRQVMAAKSYEEDPVAYYQSALKKKMPGFNWNALGIACLITAPAVNFHEVAHKLVAISLGMQATFHAAYSWLVIGIIMKYLVGFVFFVPGYVTHTGVATPLQEAAIAFAGPALNGILWFAAWFILKFKPIKLSTRAVQILVATRYINGFLFIFNMIPIGPFDGAKVFEGVM
ncbi:MAG: M50 family metallopeptidase [Thaumarchaeota archaeon]|nr:M50 family metallopeptidase [Nitrososphaerota archaeon]